MSKNNFFHSALSYEGKVLAGYKNQIETQQALLKTIKLVLPKNLSSHALYCVVSGKKVSLYTDSAVWSSQLRFYHQTILHALTASNQGNFNLLKIKIIPKTTEQEQKPKSSKKLPSSENIDFILDQAENQTDDKLKAALLKLGQTFKKLSH
ncbi:MAG: DciA family protein [Methylococcaceae bacterium]